MYTPYTPLTLYLMSIVDGINFMFVLSGSISTIAISVLYVMLLNASSGRWQMEGTDAKSTVILLKKLIKKTAVIMIVSMTMAILIPLKDTLDIMISTKYYIEKEEDK